MREMKLQDLKSKSPTELLGFAEEHSVENASTMRKQELMFAILKQLAQNEIDIIGEGVVEVLQDGFGFLRAPEANYLPGPDDIYVSPSQIRRFGLRTGDTIEGEIRSPKEGERYFALLKVNTINFEDPEKARHKINCVKARAANVQRRATDLAPIIAELQAAGFRSFNAIANELNARAIPTMSGTGRWQSTSVARLLARL